MLTNLKFHHIGIATPDIEATASMYINAGYECSEMVFDTLPNINICFLTKDGMPTIELLDPIDDKSPVVKIIEKNGTTPYHICYISENIEQDIADLRALKYMVVSKPKAACAMQNKRVAFLFHKNVGLIELVEA